MFPARSEFTDPLAISWQQKPDSIIANISRKGRFYEMDVSQAKQEHLLALKGILSSVQETDCDFRIVFVDICCRGR